ncbi:MAG TPA: cyanophycin synthetase [Bacteroidales bacterium]|nr:cyanophycin synthetase [Bacteroidales bacterium]
MKILDLHILNGPNYWSVRRHQLIVIKLDLEELEILPTDKIPEFYDRLKANLPSLYNHFCSEGEPGGFFERVKIGTWMGHVMEHIALEIQTLAGMDCGFGRTRQAGQQTGIYNVVFEYKAEEAGVFAAEAAFRITEAIVYNKMIDIQEYIEKLKGLAAAHCLGPSTRSIVNAATQRNIPHMRLDNNSLVQLGYGIYQRRINATITDSTSNIAVDIAGDKFLTKQILKRASVPVPEGTVISEMIQLEEALTDVGYPIVIKPLDSNHGKEVTTNINTLNEAYSAFLKAKEYSENILVEKYYGGDDYRILVINYKLSAVSRRVPAKVTGDGTSSVRALVEDTNNNPLRGIGHEKYLTKIKIDDQTVEALRRQDLTLDSVPAAGKTVFVKQTANLSTGGTSEDVTDIVHPDVVEVAERVARSIGLDICGIDLVMKDVCVPLKDSGVVIEVNAAPGFRMHTHPVNGKSRPVGDHVIEMLFPNKSNGRIPVTAITGTNGKTTTTRLLAHIAKTAGYHTGFTTTEGIYIGNKLTEEGDCTGPISGSKVLSDKSVEFAVLECARGGMLRQGLAFDYCDVGIVTNVAEDHLGLKDIETIEDMARVKSIVPESVKPDGYSILNADNDYTYHMMNKLQCRIALFSTNASSERIRQHCLNDGLAGVLENGNIVLVRGKKKLFIETVENIPLSFKGKATFMIENILAATLAAHVQSISVMNISQALRSFIPSAENSPGRLNIFDFSHFKLMIDYAHNCHGIKALGTLIKKNETPFNVGIIAVAGDRRDIDIINVGMAAADIFDKIIIRMDEDKRGRTDNEISNLLIEGIRKVKPYMPVEIIPDELQAIQHAVENAPEDSIIVHLSDNIKNCIAFAKKLQKEESPSYGKISEQKEMNARLKQRSYQHYESTID